MILDSLTHWKDYAWPNDRFRAGFECLESLDPNQPDGKYPIDGDDLFYMIQTYDTTPEAGHEFEAHRDYADIQVLLSGQETLLWAPYEGLTVTKPYEPDIEFQALTPGATPVILKPGLFCALFPQDAHAPCIDYNTSSKVRKAVVKVRL